jgi:hypothetical protein
MKDKIKIGLLAVIAAALVVITVRLFSGSETAVAATSTTVTPAGAKPSTAATPQLNAQPREHAGRYRAENLHPVPCDGT